MPFANSVVATSCAVLILLCLGGCASTGAPNAVLEPLEAPQDAVAPPAEASPPASLVKLLDLFRNLGYEAIGMAYESEPTLDLLYRVFSDPVTANRQIRLVYTGLSMAYDAKAQSLTVGGVSSPTQIVAFIKKIPSRR